MNTRVLVAGVLALSLTAPSAFALEVINQDKTAYTLKLTPKGGKETDLAVKASATAEANCKDGCSLSLNGTSQTFDGKAAKIWIKDGKFVSMFAPRRRDLRRSPFNPIPKQGISP